LLDVSPSVSTEQVGQLVVRVLPRLIRHLVAQMHAAPEAEGLTWPQFRVLGYLSERDYRASDIADALEIGRSTLTALGDGLARRGLIERIRDLPGDRRGVLMRLTPEGEVLHARLKARAVAGVESLLSSASESEINGLANGLDALERGLGAVCFPSERA